MTPGRWVGVLAGVALIVFGLFTVPDDATVVGALTILGGAAMVRHYHVNLGLPKAPKAPKEGTRHERSRKHSK